MAEAKITDGPIIRAINKAGPAGHERGGELEQIKFLLGHASVQTTERHYAQKGNMCSEYRSRLVACASVDST